MNDGLTRIKMKTSAYFAWCRPIQIILEFIEERNEKQIRRESALLSECLSLVKDHRVKVNIDRKVYRR